MGLKSVSRLIFISRCTHEPWTLQNQLINHRGNRDDYSHILFQVYKNLSDHTHLGTKEASENIAVSPALQLLWSQPLHHQIAKLQESRDGNKRVTHFSDMIVNWHYKLTKYNTYNNISMIWKREFSMKNVYALWINSTIENNYWTHVEHRLEIVSRRDTAFHLETERPLKASNMVRWSVFTSLWPTTLTYFPLTNYAK